MTHPPEGYVQVMAHRVRPGDLLWFSVGIANIENGRAMLRTPWTSVNIDKRLPYTVTKLPPEGHALVVSRRKRAPFTLTILYHGKLIEETTGWLNDNVTLRMAR